MITTKQFFIQFLHDNNIYDKFFYIVNKQLGITEKVFLQTHNTFSFRFIPWPIEEYNFWKNIQQKWQQEAFKTFLPYLIHMLKKYNLYEYALHIMHIKNMEFKDIKNTFVEEYPSKILCPNIYTTKHFERFENYITMRNEWNYITHKHPV